MQRLTTVFVCLLSVSLNSLAQTVRELFDRLRVGSGKAKVKFLAQPNFRSGVTYETQSQETSRVNIRTRFFECWHHQCPNAQRVGIHYRLWQRVRIVRVGVDDAEYVQRGASAVAEDELTQCHDQEVWTRGGRESRA
jgi:hypothetical protein